MIVVTYFDAVGDDFDFIDFLLFGENLSVSDTPTEIAVTDDDLMRTVALTGSFTGIGTDDPSGTITGIEARQNGVVFVSITGLDFDLIGVLSDFETLLNFTASLTFNGSVNDDVFQADVEDDTLFGFAGDDTLTGLNGADVIDGGAGVDTVDFSVEDGLNGAVINLSKGIARDTYDARDTLISIENLTGGDLDDTLFGNGVVNVLTGGAGNDVLNAKGGDDTLIGGDGDDILTAGEGDDTALGGDGDDRLGGRTGDDVLDGGAGDDRIAGQLGDDTLLGRGGADVINGGVGNDVIDGGAGDDNIKGRDGVDVIDGGSGDDRIDGGTLADRLNGGLGDDVLIGGAAGDVFVYDVVSFGDDELIRFNPSEDSFEIDTDLAANFAAVTITQVGADTVVAFAGGTITIIERDADLITESNFSFVDDL